MEYNNDYTNDIARTVKIADLKHNSDISRLNCGGELDKKDMLRLTKYAKAMAILLEEEFRRTYT